MEPDFRRHTEQRLVGTTTTSDDTDHTTGGVLDDLLGTGGELDTGLALLRVVADDGNVVTGGTTKSTTVTSLLLDVGNNGTLRDGGEGKDVSDSQGGVLSGVDELTGVHALVGDEGLGDGLELVGVTELDLGEGSTTAGVVDDLLHDTTSVSMTLSVVEGAELGRSLVETGVCRCRAKKNVSVKIDLEMQRISLQSEFCWSHSLKMDPRPFLWLRITRPMATVYIGTWTLVLRKFRLATLWWESSSSRTSKC